MLVKGPLDGVKQQKLLFRGAVSAGVFLMNHQHPYVRRFILHKWTVYKHTSNSYTWYIYIYMTGKRENELHPSKKTTHPITIYIHNSCFYQSVTTYNRWHTLHSYNMSQFFLHQYPDWTSISFDSHANFNKAVVTKFCTSHSSCAIVTRKKLVAIYFPRMA